MNIIEIYDNLKSNYKSYIGSFISTLIPQHILLEINLKY